MNTVRECTCAEDQQRTWAVWEGGAYDVDEGGQQLVARLEALIEVSLCVASA